ncbi:MAG: hypothetical protein M5U12_31955 [Verrucomicrobia bacterium]|nr:hypothetical protein [Verrucomicrobiota bacterium]
MTVTVVVAVRWLMIGKSSPFVTETVELDRSEMLGATSILT